MLLDVRAHDFPKPPNAFADLAWRGIREVQAHVVQSVSLAWIEAITGHEGDFLLDRRFQQSLTIRPRWQRHPEKEPAVRVRPRYFFRKKFIECLEHYVATLGINLANQLHVLIEEVVRGYFVRNHLVEGAGVQVGALLQLHQFADDFRGGDDPSQAQSGS